MHCCICPAFNQSKGNYVPASISFSSWTLWEQSLHYCLCLQTPLACLSLAGATLGPRCTNRQRQQSISCTFWIITELFQFLGLFPSDRVYFYLYLFKNIGWRIERAMTRVPLAVCSGCLAHINIINGLQSAVMPFSCCFRSGLLFITLPGTITAASNNHWQGLEVEGRVRRARNSS